MTVEQLPIIVIINSLDYFITGFSDKNKNENIQ